jgi:hypothetical protein
MSVILGNKKKRNFSAERLQIKQLMREAEKGNQSSVEKLKHLIENDFRYKDAFTELMRKKVNS